jgi:hypothetical protein
MLLETVRVQLRQEPLVSGRVIPFLRLTTSPSAVFSSDFL